MNREVRWGTGVVQGVNGWEGRTGCGVCDRDSERGRERERKCVTGNNGWEVEIVSGWEQAGACDWGAVADIGGPDESTSGWDHEQMSNEWVRILWSSEGLSKWTNCWTNKWVMTVCLCRLRGRRWTRACAGKWMSEAWWKRLSERVMGVSDGCVDRKCQL